MSNEKRYNMVVVKFSDFRIGIML